MQGSTRLSQTHDKIRYATRSHLFKNKCINLNRNERIKKLAVWQLNQEAKVIYNL